MAGQCDRSNDVVRGGQAMSVQPHDDVGREGGDAGVDGGGNAARRPRDYPHAQIAVPLPFLHHRGGTVG